MKRLIFLPIFISLLSCNGISEKEISNVSVKNTGTNTLINVGKLKNDSLILEETFIDSLNIGLKGKNKIEMLRFRELDTIFVLIRFYNKTYNKWIKVQDLKILYDGCGIPSLDPQFSDFNNDNFKDVTFKSAIAFRGANDIRKLLIFDKKSEKLIFMKNSSNYPNLLYNRELNCLDAFLVYGGSSTKFLKIDADSLREFAGVDIGWGELESYLVNMNGKRIRLKKVKKFEASYVRYMNYKTLKMYDDY